MGSLGQMTPQTNTPLWPGFLLRRVVGSDPARPIGSPRQPYRAPVNYLFHITSYPSVFLILLLLLLTLPLSITISLLSFLFIPTECKRLDLYMRRWRRINRALASRGRSANVRVYPPLNPGNKHLGSARASVVPLLGRTVTAGSEGGEIYAKKYGIPK